MITHQRTSLGTRAVYSSPEVVTYRMADILAVLGPARATYGPNGEGPPCGIPPCGQGGGNGPGCDPPCGGGH